MARSESAFPAVKRHSERFRAIRASLPQMQRSSRLTGLQEVLTSVGEPLATRPSDFKATTVNESI